MFSVFKLVKVLNEKGIAPDDLYRFIDTSNDGEIDTLELKQALQSFGEFQEKELHTIKIFFDLDNSGSISEREFLDQLKRA